MSATTSATEPVVQVEGVTFRYSATPDLPPVLDDVTLRVERGDFVGLSGPNGGGRTTLLKVILGLLTPHSGRVRVLGRRPRDVSRAVGYVPQHAQIDAGVPATVLDVVLTGRLVTEAALIREESRGAHFRSDFPEASSRWQRHIVFTA